MGSFTKLIIVALVAGFFTFISFHPAYQLRDEVPADFREVPGPSAPEKRAAEDKIARAYWDCVVHDIQWKYGRGQPLPPLPPDEFRIKSQDLGNDGGDPKIRNGYWRRLQAIWYAPSIWKKDYKFDLSWMAMPFELARDVVHYFFHKLTDLF